MIARIVNETIAQDGLVKFSYQTNPGAKLVTGILVNTDAEKLEASLYQENRSTPVFRKVDFGSSVTISGQEIQRKKGYTPLNVRAAGRIVSGVVKGLNVTGTKKVAIFLKIDE